MESILNEPAVVQSTCVVCGKNVEAGWFAHVEEDGRWIYLCSPECAMKHYQKDVSETGAANAAPDWSDLDKYRQAES